MSLICAFSLGLHVHEYMNVFFSFAFMEERVPKAPHIRKTQNPYIRPFQFSISLLLFFWLLSSGKWGYWEFFHHIFIQQGHTWSLINTSEPRLWAEEEKWSTLSRRTACATEVHKSWRSERKVFECIQECFKILTIPFQNFLSSLQTSSTILRQPLPRPFPPQPLWDIRVDCMGLLLPPSIEPSTLPFTRDCVKSKYSDDVREMWVDFPINMIAVLKAVQGVSRVPEFDSNFPLRMSVLTK